MVGGQKEILWPALDTEKGNDNDRLTEDIQAKPEP